MSTLSAWTVKAPKSAKLPKAADPGEALADGCRRVVSRIQAICQPSHCLGFEAHHTRRHQNTWFVKNLHCALHADIAAIRPL